MHEHGGRAAPPAADERSTDERSKDESRADRPGKDRPGPGERDGHAAAPSGRSVRPATKGARTERKERVLAQGGPSLVRSIADAIVAKDGEPFLVCPPDGRIPLDQDHGFGLYFHDCRFLSGYDLRLAGQPLDALAATAAGGTHAALELTNPDLDLPDGGHLETQTLAVRWTRDLDGNKRRLHDRIAFRNFGDDALRLPVSLSFAARFDDIFQVRGLLSGHRGRMHGPRWDGDALVLSYDGLDDLRRSLRVTVSPEPARRRDDGFELDLQVAGRGEVAIEVTLEMGERVLPGGKPVERRADHPPARPTARAARLDRGSSEADWVGGPGWTTQARSDSYLLDAVLARCLDDLRLLRASLDGRPYYEAGVPWFATLFGRDSIIACLQTLAFDTSTARGTLRLLASMQGDKEDDWRDEEPGKILHELRIGELARIGAIPHTPYFGTVDATPLFLVLLERYVAWTGDLGLFGELRGHVDRALGWLDRSAGPDGEGFVTYRSHEGRGLVNQGWKDSGDAIVDGKGRIATPPIALAEVQGYTFAARRGIADLLERAGDARGSAEQRRRAEELRERFERGFWSDRLGTYLLALGRDGEACDVVASNAGQVLWSGIASEEHARRTAERLLRDDMFGGWGIRTLSSEAVAFNPIGYHLGTVWPHDNAMIAAGFRRYRLDRQAERVFRAILEAAADFPHFRLPECFAGYGRGEFGLPVRYPVACHPQAWAAGSIPHLLTTTLGLEPDALAGRLRVVCPILPDFVDSLELQGLRVGEGRADLRFRDVGGRVDVEVLRAEGGLRVEVDDGSRAGGASSDGRRDDRQHRERAAEAMASPRRRG